MYGWFYTFLVIAFMTPNIAMIFKTNFRNLKLLLSKPKDKVRRAYNEWRIKTVTKELVEFLNERRIRLWILELAEEQIALNYEKETSQREFNNEIIERIRIVRAQKQVLVDHLKDTSGHHLFS